MNWAQLQQNSDFRSIKERLSLAAVVQHLGVSLEKRGDRLVGQCPFHADTDPSFSVWATEEGDELCGCWSCDFRPSDVYSFIERKLNLNFTQAAKVALAYLNDGLPDAPDIPERVYDAQPSRSAVAEAAYPTHAVYEFLKERGLPIDDAWLVAEFRLGVNRHGEIVIPHIAADGDIRAAKHRRPDSKPITVPGGRLDALYGEWRDRGRKAVVLCEGESDTWLTAWVLRHVEVDVLGLPSGVSAFPKAEWIDRLRNREVTLMFDADEAGRRGAAMWALELASAADSVMVAALADGQDACGAGETAIAVALRDAFQYVDAGTLAISEVSGRYVRVNQTTGMSTDLSDFVFSVESVTVMQDGSTYFELEAGRHKMELSTAVLSNPNKFRQWCMDKLLAWKGGARDAAELLEILKAHAVFAKRFLGTDVTGLHDGTFVLPDGSIGPGGWKYIGEDVSVKCDDYVRVQEAPFHRTIVRQLALMHDPAVMTPILGWVAAAPMRTLCSQFPILAVVGGAGYGKTTLVQTVLQAFRFWSTSPMVLSSTTAHGVQSFMSSTNAFPVWFDEYRLGARREAKLALDQGIRDAWDGSSSVKGGYGENKVALKYLPAIAPIVVTGEDAFSETSHAERMLILGIGPKGKNPAALAAVETLQSDGLGYDYLRWLANRMAAHDFPAPPHEHDRHRQAVAVAAWGYDLLNEYADGQLPPFDATLAEQEFDDLAAQNPYLEVLKQGIELRDRQGAELVWFDGEDLCVRRRALLGAIKSNGIEIVLPGGERAMGRWLAQQYTVTTGRDYRGLFDRYEGAAAAMAI